MGEIRFYGASAPFFIGDYVAQITDYPVKLVNAQPYSVTIPATENFSEPKSLSGTTLVGLRIPPGSYDNGGSGLIQIAFYASIDGYSDPYELLVTGENTPINGIGTYFPTAGGVKIPLSPAVFVGFCNIKLYIYQLQSFDVKIDLLLAPVLQ